MLRVEGLIVPPLPPLSFDVGPGECLGIEGASGAGKTRILRALADLDAARGSIRFEGVLRDEVAAPQWRRLVRYVPAEPGWFAATAVEHAPAGAAGQKFRRLMSDLDIEADHQVRPIETLSTGERRRIALALALADEPRCLLLDEPTVGLDTARAALVHELIRYQLLGGRVVVIASHDQSELTRLADQRLQLTPPTAVEPSAPHPGMLVGPRHAVRRAS